MDTWQGGIVQNIEAADTSLYVVYQHADGDVTGRTGITTPLRRQAANGAPTGKTSLDAFQEIVVGTKINF